MLLVDDFAIFRIVVVKRKGGRRGEEEIIGYLLTEGKTNMRRRWTASMPESSPIGEDENGWRKTVAVKRDGIGGKES